METKMDWENEAPLLARIDKINKFDVPKNYFVNLTSQITSTVKLNNIVNKENLGFTVPNNYFEESKEQIIANCNLLAINEHKVEAFKVPDNYFEQLSNDIKSQTKSPIIKLWQKNIFKYSAAASIILMLSGAWFLNQTITTKNNDIAQEQRLYDIDENTIINYINEDNSNINNIDQKQLEEYILSNYTANEISRNL